MRDEGETVDLAKMLAELPQGNPVHVFLFLGTQFIRTSELGNGKFLRTL